MFHIVLVHPDIPQNTGNIIRLCANTGCQLHLITPMGFPLDDQKLKRAGLDYHEFSSILVHHQWEGFQKYLEDFSQQKNITPRLFALSTKATQVLGTTSFQAEDFFVFGSETKGLPSDVFAQITEKIRLPMMPNSRSLNLANSVSIMAYEAWRQNNFLGGL
jgi:tRNA (cytidine/uridine-2'-O-)-methyltransferase